LPVFRYFLFLIAPSVFSSFIIYKPSLSVYKNKIEKIENSNYRPILFLSCMSTILEKIIYKSIYEYCVSHELLNSKKSELEHCTDLRTLGKIFWSITWLDMK
jgi:hypothetical protein